MILTDYNETYAHKMHDKEYLDAYLEACLQESDEAFYVGLRRAVQAHENGFTWIAAQTGLGRESLYRALSAEGNPSFRTIRKVMRALGADESILAQTRAFWRRREHFGADESILAHTETTAAPKRKPVKRSKTSEAVIAQ